MSKELKTWRKYVIGDDYFEIWQRKIKRIDYEYCVAKEIKRTLLGYSFELSIEGAKVIKIRVIASRKDELYDFWEELQTKLKTSFDEKVGAKNLINTANSAIPKNIQTSNNSIPSVFGVVKECCPKCKGKNFHAFVDKDVVAHAKVKTYYTVNINPLKPLTFANKKEKIVRDEITTHTSYFVCDDCGKIFK